MKMLLLFFSICLFTSSLATDYLKIVLADGNTILVPASCVESLFSDSNGKHVYLKITKDNLSEAVYYNDIYKYDIVLPQTIQIASGVNCHIYFENLHNNRYKINNSLIFDGIGTSNEKDWSFTPLDSDSGANITIQNTLSTQTSTRNVRVLNSKNRTGRLNILTVGDSYTDIGTYQDVFLNKLSTSGYEVHSIGRKTTNNGSKNENISGGLMEDFSTSNQAVKFSVSGVTNTPIGYWPVYTDGVNKWQIYFSKIDENGNGYMEARLYSGSYEGKLTNGGVLTFCNIEGAGQQTINFSSCDNWSLNPFWNITSNQLDFQNYITSNGFDDPDVLVVQFLLNDINESSTLADINSTIGYIKTFVEKFHTQYPTAKIVYSLQPIGSLYWKKSSTNYDLSYYNRFNFIRKFLSEFENNPTYNYLYIAPGYAWVDRENGYNLQATTNNSSNVFVNGDYSAFFATDVIHCNTAGMTQLGECIYSTILGALTSEMSTDSPSLKSLKKEVISTSYFTPTGLSIKMPFNGIYIKRTEYNDGSVTVNKGIR